MKVLVLFAIAVVFSFDESVQAPIDGVSLIFNGTTITDPILIYHDEIGSTYTTIPTDENSDGPGDLVCRSASIGRTFWRDPTGANVPTNTSADFYNVRTPTSDPQAHPFLARLYTIDYLNSTNSTINGLWICPLGFTGNISVQDIIDNFIYVGIYSRNSGYGVINTSSISLVDSSFMADPPSFTLIGDTTGGPPESSIWTRNGVTISDDDSYNISLTVPGVASLRVFDFAPILQESRYRSTLTVTGNLPGVYVYSVINRAMSEPRTASFTIEGGVITDLTAVQTGLTTVQVTWTAPPVRGPPAGGYQITVAEANIDVTGQESPYTFTTSKFGVHTVQVMYTSQHFPNEHEQALPVIVIVEDIRATISISSLTSTSADILWFPPPPEFLLPVAEYTVSLKRVTGSGQTLCTQVMDSRPAVTTTDTSMSFGDLEEFSTYTVTVVIVNTTFNVFGSNMDVASDMMFTTPRTAPTGAPLSVILSITSRNISVAWTPIDCIKRNGIISHYTVIFQKEGEADDVLENTVDMIFNVEELSPGNRYTFQVAGVNEIGTGPFAMITFTTNIEVSDTCPAGTYRVTTAGGDDVCRVCPANSVTTTVCECIQGYYTHHLEDPSVSCTRPPSACRELQVIESHTIANTVTVLVEWEQPFITGRDDYYYNVHHSNPDLQGSYLLHNINPFIDTSPLVKYSVSGLRPLTNYTIRVSVLNGVSDQDTAGEEGRRCEVTVITGDTNPQAPRSVSSFCEVIVWRAPSRAYGVITGYDVMFADTVSTSNSSVVQKLVLKDRDQFFHVVRESDLPRQGGAPMIQVRAKTDFADGIWSPAIPLNCSNSVSSMSEGSG